MNPTPFSSKTTPWRVQLPARFSADGKRKARYFETLKAAKEFCSAIKKNPLIAVDQKITIPVEVIEEHGPLITAAIKKLGGDPAKVFEAIEFYRKMKLNVKGALVMEAADAFSDSRKPRVARDTWTDDNSRLRKFVRAYGNANLVDITEADLEQFFDEAPGHHRSIYKTMSVFFAWARRYNYVAINPMANVRPRQRWKARKAIYPVETFARMLRITAGLEGSKEGEEPSREFSELLPWLVLSGFCGLRSCEAFQSFKADDAIKWTDLHFDRGFIHIRDGVAKRTKRENDKRNIHTSAYVEAARAWLALVPHKNQFIVPVLERNLINLKKQFLARTGIKFKENALRNSFASYALATDGKDGVGRLALEMGNSEAICKQFYVETLEPRAGVAWFALRPDRPANVVDIAAAVA